MRRILLFFAFYLFLINSGKSQSCSTSTGCSNFNNQFPTGTLTPTTSWTTVNGMNGGNWTLFSVVAGNTYEWTYCESVGGISTSCNAQLTLYNGNAGLRYCYSDNDCGTNGNAPYIRWTAPFTETVRLLTSVFNCATNAPNPPYNRLAYRQVPGATYNLILTVNNITGARSNAKVILYNSSFTPLQTLFTNSSGQVTFTGLTNANYNYEVYYTPPNSPPVSPNGEFWGSGTATISGASVSQSFTRIQPYISSAPNFSSFSPTLGQTSTGTFTVRNGLPYTQSSRVELWVDRNQASSWDYNNTSSIQSISSGNTSNFFFNVTPANTGPYYFYAFVYSLVNGSYILTDQYNWTQAFSVDCPVLATPTSPYPGTVSGPGPVFSTTPTFSWGGNSSGIYHLQIWNADTNPINDDNVIYGFEVPSSSPGHCINGLLHTLPSGVLANNTAYKWRVHRNDPCGECESSPTGLLYFQTNASTSCTVPTSQASNVSFTGNDGISVTINWQIGNGQRRLVKINTVNSFTNPINGIEPSSITPTYQNSGEQVIYFGTGNSVYINQLTQGTTYYVKVYEANCTGSQVLYNTNSAVNNPASVTMTGTQQAPIAEFTANKSTLVSGEYVQFYDLSLNNPTSWRWEILRESSAGNYDFYTVSNDRNPLVLFNLSNSYTVRLIATNNFGQNMVVKTGYIYVKPNPTAHIPEAAAMTLSHYSYYGGDPVNMANKYFVFNQQDIQIKGRKTVVSIDRNYSSNPIGINSFGYGWNFDYEMRLEPNEWESRLFKGDGSYVNFAMYPGGKALSQVPALDDSLYYTTVNGNTIYTYVRKDGIKWEFRSDGYLVKRIDLDGNTTDIIRNGTNIDKIVLPGGRQLVFGYNAQGKISAISDSIGLNNIHYYYNSAGNLLDSVVFNQNQSRIWYKYNANNLLEEIVSPNNARIIKNTYNGNKVVSQSDAFDAITQIQENTPAPGYTTVVNPLGKTKVLKHDFSYMLTEIKNELGHVRKLIYTPEHRLDSLIDERGNKYKFYTDNRGNVTKTIDPLNNSDSISFNQFGKPTYVKDKEGNVTTLTYSPTFNPSVITMANTGEYQISYDQYGQDTAIIDPLNHILRKKYTAQGDLEKIIRKYSVDSFRYDVLGRLTTYVNGRKFRCLISYNHYNQPTRIVDQFSYAEFFDYDPNGNLIKYTDRNGTITSFSYDAKDRLIKIVKAGITIKENEWNILDNLVRSRDANKNCIIISYDDMRRPIRIADSILGTIAEYAYDEVSNRVEYKNSFGNSWKLRFDELNRYIGMKNPNGDSMIIKFNRNDLPIDLIDELGNSVKLFYNSTNSHIKTIDKIGNVVEITPNLKGLPSVIKDPKGSIRNMTYDEDDRLSTFSEGFGTHQFFYDSANNRVQYNDALGNVLKWDFNSRNEITAERWNNSIQKRYSFSRAGQLTSASGIGNTHYLTYNDLGFIVKDSSSFGNAAVYRRDSAGNTKKIIFNDGKEVAYTFNSLNRSTSITDWNNNTILINRDNEGGISSLVYPNNTRIDITRNNAYQVTSWINAKNGPEYLPFQKNNLIYSIRGEIEADTSTINYYPDISVASINYPTSSYNSWDRKISYQGNNYTYNANGGLTNVTGAGLNNTYQYNTDGIINSTYHFGVLNTSSRNGMEHRTQKTISFSPTRYLLGYGFSNYPVTLQESNLSTVTATNIFSPEGLLLARDSAGSIKYFHHNAYGNTIALSNPAGDITDTYAYTIFGNNFTHSGNSTQPFTWQGMYGVQRDTKDLYYIWHRVYDANSGTFLSKDPIQGSLSETRNLNPYLYGLNDPLSYADPTGLKPVNINENWYNRLFNVTNAAFEGVTNQFKNINIGSNDQLYLRNRLGNIFIGDNLRNIFNGNQYVSVTSAANRFGSITNLGRSAFGIAGNILDGVEVYNGYLQDNRRVGYNTQVQSAGVIGGAIGGWAGAEAGAIAGAAIGSLFGGVGAVPGAIIGAIIGNIFFSNVGEQQAERAARSILNSH